MSGATTSPFATAWALFVETPTSRLRVKTVAVGVSLQNSLFKMWQFVIPLIFNPDQAHLGAKTAPIYGGIAVLCLLYLWFFQPETAKRSYEELDEMFMKRVAAQRFKKFKTETEMRGTTAMEMEATAAAKNPE
ncbi:hypothetical protein CEP54_006462 [Fusarium duplospermum]|uniref:Major facilitator superfamily (MFS) profile domain-containing protein n=1 Tax=Fusarium duplospermum TaxID=1325734 RepID=A0A428Q6Z3_9HYPO|nr:hypothetical protein CEP54_006462 [Fusarium duplospermum]